MKSLTKKQKKVLDYISDSLSKQEQSPTVNEIKNALGFKSTRSVSQYLEALVEKGYITKSSDARSIKLVNYYEKVNNETVLLPLYGLASCGTPEFYADENIQDYISVDEKLLKGNKKNYYLVRAKGTSMNKEIDNDSLVLLEKKDYYDEKENILAVVNGKAIIKKLFKGFSALLLMPSSTEDSHKPLVVRDDFYIAGKVICTIPDPNNTEEIRYVPL